jgi:hypothetical protein
MPDMAYHVNIFGVSEASYELQAKNDEAAKTEALQFLYLHPPVVEVWDGPRWVARFNRNGRPACAVTKSLLPERLCPQCGVQPKLIHSMLDPDRATQFARSCAAAASRPGR